ncbi:MAG: type II toxin-antitoxin system Phd/YefM family antitoxin [Candidatus Omnitrophota bacterium]
MTTIALSEAKNKLSHLVKRTALTLSKVAISVNGQPQAILMSTEEYESLIETIEILKNHKLTSRIAKALDEIKRGDTVPFEDIRRDV